MSVPKVPNVRNIRRSKSIIPAFADTRGRILALGSAKPEIYDIHFVENGERKIITITTQNLLIMIGERDAEDSGQSDDNGSG